MFSTIVPWFCYVLCEILHRPSTEEQVALLSSTFSKYFSLLEDRIRMCRNIFFFAISQNISHDVVVSGYGLPGLQALHPQRPGNAKHPGGERDQGEDWWLRPDQGAAAGQGVLHGQRAGGEPHLLVRRAHCMSLLADSLVVQAAFPRLCQMLRLPEVEDEWFTPEAPHSSLSAHHVCCCFFSQVRSRVSDREQVLCGVRCLELRSRPLWTLHLQR